MFSKRQVNRCKRLQGLNKDMGTGKATKARSLCCQMMNFGCGNPWSLHTLPFQPTPKSVPTPKTTLAIPLRPRQAELSLLLSQAQRHALDRAGVPCPPLRIPVTEVTSRGFVWKRGLRDVASSGFASVGVCVIFSAG